MICKLIKTLLLQRQLHQQATWDELWDFHKLFPAPLDDRFAVMIRTKCDRYLYYIALGGERPFKDFYQRWSRFKNLKAFL